MLALFHNRKKTTGILPTYTSDLLLETSYERKDLQTTACYHWILSKLQGLNIWKVLTLDHIKAEDLDPNFPRHISLIKFTFQSLKKSLVQIK